MRVFLAELRLFLTRLGALRAVLLHLAVLLSFGVWIPRLKGADFFDPEALAAYICLGLIFAGPAAAQLFAQESTPDFSTAASRAGIGLLYGEIAALVLTGTGIATVYASQRGHFLPTPDWKGLEQAALLGLAGSAMAALLAAWLAVWISRRVAMTGLRVLLFGTLILFYYRGQWLPEVALKGAAICAALAVVFAVLLRRACRSV